MILASIVPIIIAVLALVIGSIAAFYLVRMSKGKLELHMPRTGFGSGERVVGTVTMLVFA